MVYTGKELRKSGIELIGDVPWGTHFCQFYRTRQDLLETLLPYFSAGLENNEFCMCITAEPLNASQVRRAMKKGIPGFEEYIARGQIEIVPYDEWYVLDGVFDEQRVLQGWVDKLAGALAKGFAGLRLSGNTFWLEKKDWQGFSDYEAAINEVIGQYRMLALCTYSLDKCNSTEVIDVIQNHQFALIKDAGRWDMIESAIYRQARDELRRSEEKYHTLFRSMNEGFALHEIVLDSSGKPCDYRFLEANDAFGHLTGLSPDKVIGKTVRQVIPEVEGSWIERYGRVALTGKPAQFESYSAPLNRWYEVYAYSLEKGQFAAVFMDITGRKHMEEQLSRQASVLNTVMANTGAMLVYLDRDFNFIMANKAYTESCGHPWAELEGRNHFALFPNPENESIFRRVRDTGEVIAFHDKPFEYVHQPWRETTYWDWTLVPVKDEAGGVTGLVLSLIETTARKKAEAELHRHREHLEEMVEERTRQLRHVAQRLVNIQESERAKISKELHDEIGQLLTYAALLIDKAGRKLDPESLAEARSTIQEALSAVRNLSSMLSPRVLRSAGLLEALSALVEDYQRRTSISVDYDHDMFNQVSEEMALACYRIVQEALTNVARHARASKVRVRLLEKAGILYLEVADNGNGFDPETVRKSTGMTGMRERALALGGELAIESGLKRGTRVRAEIPLLQPQKA